MADLYLKSSNFDKNLKAAISFKGLTNNLEYLKIDKVY